MDWRSLMSLLPEGTSREYHEYGLVNRSRFKASRWFVSWTYLGPFRRRMTGQESLASRTGSVGGTE
jgi:hypothetical protein